MAKHIMIVDDSQFTRHLLKLPLERMGYIINDIGSPSDAINHLDNGKTPDLIISDLKMPELADGINFLKSLEKQAPQVPILLYTSDGKGATLSKELKLPCLQFLSKPASPDRLRTLVQEMVGDS